MKIVALPLAPLGGVPEGTARLLGDALAGELRKRSGVSVLSERLRGARDEAFLDALPAIADALLAEPGAR